MADNRNKIIQQYRKWLVLLYVADLTALVVFRIWTDVPVIAIFSACLVVLGLFYSYRLAQLIKKSIRPLSVPAWMLTYYMQLTWPLSPLLFYYIVKSFVQKDIYSDEISRSGEVKYCKDCGTCIIQGSKFCVNCGKRIDQTNSKDIDQVVVVKDFKKIVAKVEGYNLFSSDDLETFGEILKKLEKSINTISETDLWTTSTIKMIRDRLVAAIIKRSKEIVIISKDPNEAVELLESVRSLPFSEETAGSLESAISFLK